MKVLIVGAGHIGTKEVSELSRHPNVSVSGIVDSNQSQLETVTREFNIDGYRELSTALDESSSDLVRIATPPHTHYRLSMEALRQGKDVYIEKIMTLTSDQAREIVGYAHSSGLNVYIRRNAIYTPVYMNAYRMLSEIGRIIRIDWIESVGEYTDWSTHKADWLKKLPGGIISEHLPHAIYLIRWFIGGQPTVTSANYEPRKLSVEMAYNDLKASISYLPTTDSPMLLRIVGDEGILDINHSTMQVRIQKGYENYPPAERAIRSNLHEVGATSQHVLSLAKKYAKRRLSTIWDVNIDKNDQFTDHYRQYTDIVDGNVAQINGAEGLKNVELFEDIWSKAGIDCSSE